MEYHTKFDGSYQSIIVRGEYMDTLIVFSHWDDFEDDDGEMFIMSHMVSSFGSKQTTWFSILKNRIIGAWLLLSGKEHRFFDVVFEGKDEIKKLKEFIDSVSKE